MIGMNDTTSETFATADVDTLTAYMVGNGLAGLHLWSLDRDTPCADSFASPTCDSVSGTTALEYTGRFLSDLGADGHPRRAVQKATLRGPPLLNRRERGRFFC
jgi:chitinase